MFDNPNWPATLARDFLEDAKTISTERVKDMAGYALVAWGPRGYVSSSIRVRDGRWLGLMEAPAFVKSILEGRVNEPD